MDNEEYVRRVVKLRERIARMYPYPEDADLDWGDWKHAHRRRERAERRILELPCRWRACAKNEATA
jgi:hypothetical protein